MDGVTETVLGSITVELVIDDVGALEVRSTVDGTIQYVTGLGMLEMAKQNLDGLVGDDA